MTVGFWNFVLCFIWPWHTLTAVERLSAATDRLVCDRCGRQYAVNHDVMAVLSWDEVESFYRDRKRMCR